MIRFDFPEILYALFAIPLVILLHVLFNRSAEARRGKFAAPGMMKHLLGGDEGKRRTARLVIFVMAVTALVVTLARPQWGVEPKETRQVGIDILVALDVSLSMAAEDIAPNRLAKAKKEVERLADAFAGNRLGLLIFAGEASMEAPLTSDVSTFKLFLGTITTASTAVAGTDITGALMKGISALKESPAKSKVLLLITDGEDNEGNPADAARAAAEKNIRIYTLGIGDQRGSPIPIRDEKGDLLGYKRDSAGHTVMTKLNPDALKEVAQITGGECVLTGGGDMDMGPVIESIKSLEKSDITSMKFTTYIERYQWPASLALFLVILESFI